MDQKAIIDAIEKQMDVLESIFNWIIIFTIPVFWAGLQRANEIEALGITFNLSQAYFGISVQIYLSLHRIGDFLNLLDKENTPGGISKLLFHKYEQSKEPSISGVINIGSAVWCFDKVPAAN